MIVNSDCQKNYIDSRVVASVSSAFPGHVVYSDEITDLHSLVDRKLRVLYVGVISQFRFPSQICCHGPAYATSLGLLVE